MAGGCQFGYKYFKLILAQILSKQNNQMAAVSKRFDARISFKLQFKSVMCNFCCEERGLGAFIFLFIHHHIAKDYHPAPVLA